MTTKPKITIKERIPVAETLPTLMVGHHMTTQHGVGNALRLIIQLGGNVIQVFLSPPNSASKGKPLSSEDIHDTLHLIETFSARVFVHGKYLYNFCRNNVPWHSVLSDEMQEAAKIGADVVIHQGKNVSELKLNRQDALKNYVTNIEHILLKTPGNNKILLENSCQQGTELGYTLLELSVIYNLFSDKARQRIGFCIDTCHIFVAGSLDMTPDSVICFFRQFDRLIGLKHLRLVHLNNSSIKFDGHNDSHANLMKGHIPWEGLSTFINECVRYSIPMVMETDSALIQEEINLVRSVIIPEL